jgi:fucose permease
MMTNEIVRRSLKRVAVGMVCVALLSQAVPTIGSAAADQYDSSDDNTGTTVLVIAGVGAAAYFISHAAYQKNHPKMPTP